MARPRIPKRIETEVLTSSKRKCCLCVGIDGNYSPRPGQIAHIDHDNANNKVDNLTWLCLEHHTMYDSKTSQHKNYTKEEVKHYRNTLYKYLLQHPNIDKPNINRFDKTKPFCLMFDGISDCIKLASKDFLNLDNFSLECIFKLYDEKYTGILMSIDNFQDDSFYCFIYYSIEHKEFPGELHLKYIDKAKETNESLASITIDKLEWKKLRLTINKDKLDFELGNQRISAFYKYSGFKFEKIQIAGRFWPNQTGSFLSCYMSYFKVYDNSNDEVIKELVFDYGHEYLLKLPKIEGMELINGTKFYKIPE